MLRGSPRGPPKLSSQSPRCACQSHPEEPLAGPESTQVGGSLWGSPAEAWQVPGPGIVRPRPPPRARRCRVPPSPSPPAVPGAPNCSSGPVRGLLGSPRPAGTVSPSRTQRVVIEEPKKVVAGGGQREKNKRREREKPDGDARGFPRYCPLGMKGSPSSGSGRGPGSLRHRSIRWLLGLSLVPGVKTSSVPGEEGSFTRITSPSSSSSGEGGRPPQPLGTSLDRSTDSGDCGEAGSMVMMGRFSESGLGS